jgi:glycine cleavage system H protein
VEGGEGRIRFGLDGFAASFMPCPRHIRRAVPPGPLDRGEELCEIEFDAGVLTLGMPVYAKVSRWNRALEDDPTAVVTAPYGQGWIVELVLATEGELENLLMAQAAQKQARLDCRRFRRRLALHLLVNDEGPGPALPDDGRLLTDLRQILGGRQFVALLRELIH